MMFKEVLISVLLMNLNYTLSSAGLYDVYSQGGAAAVFAVGTDGLTLKSLTTGNTYSSMYVGTNTLYSVFAKDNNVWSVGANGTLNYSLDYGDTWISRNIAGNTSLRSVFFVDSFTGYIAGANGLILKSSDGGNNWVNLSSGTLNDLNKIKFVNPTAGFACGDNGTFLKTINGGGAWVPVSLPVTGGISSFDVFENFFFLGTDNCTLLRSTDSGLSWNTFDFKMYSRPKITSIAIRIDTAIFAAFESGTIMYSRNHGNSFAYSSSPMLADITSIMLSFPVSYAVSKDNIAVLRSNSNGLTWIFPSGTQTTINFTEILSGYGMSFNKTFDMNYQKRGVVYALQQNRLMRSADLGENWALLSTLPYGRCSMQFLVSMKDSSKMIGVLNNMSSYPDSIKATVYRTTNYGLNWSISYTCNSDYIGNMMTQDPNHPDTVYLGTQDSVIRTTDFGVTWMKIAGGPYDDWCDIAVNPGNSNILYSSTNHYPARINKSTDGGFTWFMIDQVFDTVYCENPAIAVSNLNPNMVFHAQLGYNVNQIGLKRSYSLGNTWLFNVFTGISWSVDISKDDPNVFAYGSVSLSPVYLSVNGGANFIATVNNWAEQIFFYDRSNMFTNNHDEIYKMRVSYIMPIGIQPISSNVPVDFALSQNYPNPFNPVTNINIDIPYSSFVKMAVYDVLGKERAVLVNSDLKAGSYKVDWDASNYSSGVYFYKLETKDFSESKKMILIK